MASVNLASSERSTGIEITPRIEVRTMFPQIPETQKELLVEIMEIQKEIRARGEGIRNNGSVPTMLQSASLSGNRRIDDATSANRLFLHTTQWRRRDGLWAVEREGEEIMISSRIFEANSGSAIRDDFDVRRVTTTGRDVPYVGFMVGSMHQLLSESMPMGAPDIGVQTEIGPKNVPVESFDGQNLTMLLERFRDRFKERLQISHQG